VPSTVDFLTVVGVVSSVFVNALVFGKGFEDVAFPAIKGLKVHVGLGGGSCQVMWSRRS
jgi:hypothetical protein